MAIMILIVAFAVAAWFLLKRKERTEDFPPVCGRDRVIDNELLIFHLSREGK